MAEGSPREHTLSLGRFDLLQNRRGKVCQGLFGQTTPYIMSKVEEMISVDLRLGHIKVGSDERNEDGVENVVDKLVQQLEALVQVRQREFGLGWSISTEPRYARNLDDLVSMSSQQEEETLTLRP